jgi:shikimate kinase/3-dehydroquinate synthase
MAPRDLAIVGLPGVGKSSLGKRLAGRLGVPYLDVDRAVVAATGVANDTIAAIFEREGEAGFRSRERGVIAGLVAPIPPSESVGAALGIGRVVALGGGAVADPRNRWVLRDRARLLWLDAPDALILERLAGARVVRPLFATGDPATTLARLRAERQRFYATGLRLLSSRSPATLADSAVDLLRAELSAAELSAVGPDRAARLLDTPTTSGRWVVGTGIAASAVYELLNARGATRVVIASEARAAAAFGNELAATIARHGVHVISLTLPSGEEAKRLSVIESAAKELAEKGVERGDLLVAVGGGALTDAAGLLAALYLRGIDWVAVPTTLAAQIDASLGGKTGADLDEGKNLIGAFHQPEAVIADLNALRTLPARELVAAAAEAAKIALLGESRLFDLLEAAAPRILVGDPTLHDDGTIAEIVERAGWWKCEVVRADERESGARMSLNLGHTLGHALEQAAGYRDLLHGEAVGYGLRTALTIGEAMGVTPETLAARGRALLDALHLGVAARHEPLDAIQAALGRDKKVAAGQNRWVLATNEGYVIRDDVPASLVTSAATAALAGTTGG